MGLLDELYKEILLQHYKHPHNYGDLENANLWVKGDNPSCGDRIELWLKTDGSVIQNIHFKGQGCAISQASASLMTDLVKGKSWKEAHRLTAQFKTMIVDGAAPAAELGDLAAFAGVHKLPARVKCATLAWNALEEASGQSKL